jgi:hypothetical protein
MLGNVQGHTCAYWGHGLSNYLINFMPPLKDRMLKKVGKTIAEDFMAKRDVKKYDLPKNAANPVIISVPSK